MGLKNILYSTSLFVISLCFSQHAHKPSLEGTFDLPQATSTPIKAPCDLKKISEGKTLPSINIIGEQHSSLESQNLHATLIDQARRGKFIVGLEGVLYSRPDEILRDHIRSITHKEPEFEDHTIFFGIEEGMSFGLGILIKTHSEAKKHKSQSNINGLSSLILKTKKDINRYPF